jgi:hypothetical protein
MESLRYLLLCLACGVIAVWAGENLFWFIPPAGLRPVDLALTVLAYSVASGVALSAVIVTGAGGLPAAFLGGAVMGYMAEGVIVGTIYQALPFYWVWTPLAWHALVSGALVLGLGRAGHRLGPRAMAGIWILLGLMAAFWGQYWPSEHPGRMSGPQAVGAADLAVYLALPAVAVVLAHAMMDRFGSLPRPPRAVLAMAPGLALVVWIAQGVADPRPLRLVLPVALALLWWTMRRLGRVAPPSAARTLGAPVPLWQHALLLLAPLTAVALAPLVWRQDMRTFGANWVIAGITCVVSMAWLVRLVWRAGRAA